MFFKFYLFLKNNNQVYLDFGLAIPKLSVHGMTSSLKELLELAPIKKVNRPPCN
jgi:hypothetical protein